jgi:hypothetical protein
VRGGERQQMRIGSDEKSTAEHLANAGLIVKAYDHDQSVK